MRRSQLSVNNILFFSDLDNTLLYSHRHEYGGGRVWVEKLHGRDQSFITEKTYAYLLSQNWLNVVPVTTRTMPQFERLRGAAEALNWRHALICNGAILLDGFNEDKKWRAESERMAEPFCSDLVRLRKFMAGKLGSEAVISFEPFLIYARTGRAGEMCGLLASMCVPSRINIFHDSRKVYCFPSILNKGKAVLRYAEKYGHAKFIAAGDSELDVPMLNASAIGLCPQAMASALNTEAAIYSLQGVLSDEICDALERIRNDEDFN